MKEPLLIGALVLAGCAASRLEFYEFDGVRIAALPRTPAEVAFVEPGKLYLDPMTDELRQQRPLPARVQSRFDLDERFFDWCVGSGADREFCVCTVTEIGPSSRTTVSDDELQFALAVFALAPLPGPPGRYEDAAEAIVLAGLKCAAQLPAG